MRVEYVKDMLSIRINAGDEKRELQLRTGEDTTVIEAKLEAWREILTGIKEYERDEY